MNRRIKRLENKAGPKEAEKPRLFETFMVEATPEGPRYTGEVYVMEIGSGGEEREEFRPELKGLPAPADDCD